VERDRVAEVHVPAQGGRPGGFGSGYLLTNALALTAGHVVGAPGSRGRVRELGAQDWRKARVAWRGDAIDAAVLELDDPVAEPPSRTLPSLGALATDVGMPCRAVGFPAAQQRQGQIRVVRDVEEVTGEIAPLSALKKGLLTIHVGRSAPLPGQAGTSPWAGMSGAAVFCGHLLVGVVRLAPGHFGTDRLECVPISTLTGDARFRETVTGVPERELAVEPVEQALADWLPTLLAPVLAGHRRFGGRETELGRLDAFLREPAPPVLLVTAPSGLGKTALLVNWLDRLERRDDGPKAVYTFLSGHLEQLVTRDFTLRNLCQQLSLLHQSRDPLPSSAGELTVRYHTLLTAAPPPRGLVVIVDALDEARGWEPDAHLIPRPLPAGVRIVLSAREVAGIDWPDELGLGPADAEVLRLRALQAGQVDHLLKSSGAPAWVREPEALATITDKSRGDPFYLRFLLDDVQSGEIESLADLRKQPQEVEAYLGKWWQQVAASAKDKPVRDLLGYLLAARGLLLRDELVSISDEDDLDGWTFDSALAPVRRFIVGSAAEGYALAHARFGEYLSAGPLKTEVRTYRKRLLAWCERWHLLEEPSRYALRHYLSHLADAIDEAHKDDRRARIDQLAGVIADEEFQTRHLDVLNDLPGLSRDLETALAHVAAAAPPRATSIVRAVLAVETFRRRRFEPASVYDVAAAGAVEDAERRLGLFGAEEQWAFAARLVIAWDAADTAPDDAGQLMARLTADIPPWEPIPLLTERVRHWLAGARDFEPDLPLPYPPLALPQPPSEEEAGLIVTRMGGSTDVSGFEAVERLGRPSPGHDEGRAYIAERDSPRLVAFATARPDPGAELLSDYVAIHAANPYREYRNRSLWAILSAACAHPDPTVARDLARQLVEAALAPPAVAFREGLNVTIAALKAAAGDAGAVARFEALKQEAVDATHRLFDRRWRSDSWGHHCRRLAVLAEAEAVALGRCERAAELLDRARQLPRGFAGFQSSASLRLAEAARICAPDDGTAGVDDVQAALESAHNVQDPPLCAQRTARVNAMRERWWPGPIPNARAVLEGFAADPLAADFAPLHIVGEKYERRRRDAEMLSLPDSMLAAQTLEEVADVYQVPCAALQALNPTPGPQVHIRDSGFAPLVAARLAAEALVHPGIADDERGALIARLIPAAADSPTAADTVLSRLLLAERPADAGALDALGGLAPTDWLQEPTASTATELGPA
jgi:AAA ATPase domain/Trypsin-like peptidase domain